MATIRLAETSATVLLCG